MFNLDISGIEKMANDMDKKLNKGLALYGTIAGDKMVTYAKANAKWENQTGLARKTITKIVEVKGDKFIVGLQGNTDYSVFLELAHQKKYAILYPTLLKYQKEIEQDILYILTGKRKI